MLLFCCYLSFYRHHYFHSHHHLFHLYKNSTNVLMSYKNCYYILTDYTWHNNIKIFYIVYKCIIGFDINDLNGALILKISCSFLLLAILVLLAFIPPFTTIYASLLLPKSYLSIEVLNLIFLLAEYLPLHKSFISIHFVTNFNADESFNSLDLL